IEAGSRSDAFITVLDVAPTLLQLADVTHPAPEFDGRRVHSMIGESFYPHLIGRQPVVHGPEHVFGLELFNRRMIRQGDWKLLWNNKPWGKESWELYNLEEDPGEQNDLAQARPGKLQDMLALWQQYVGDNDILVFDELKMRFTNGKDHYEYQ
ncbi:MAG: arylsulfatase, partial [Gammaproteobacteria bacterium]|nr:arylsulfatase [Gammaproteobacteria bacterium]